MKKTAQLKQMLASPSLDFLMEAHNGMSAKIVEKAGFKGIWGSGLSISGALGVRDNNEASWTQILEVVEFMSDATSIPILLDGDTGYGNFNNMRRLVKKLGQRDVAGVCIEDKVFPKTNSFLRGESQPLADIDEFCGKIKAGKDTQLDDDFCIVARVEALIAGWGLKEALDRADAYRQAGADAILIHSKQPHPTEVFEFLKEWDNRGPIVLVPTKYYTTPTEEFRNRNVSLVIWANQLFRGAIRKMQQVAEQLYNDQNLLGVEDNIVPVKTIFSLQDDEELIAAEEMYLSQGRAKKTRAIILAATRGKKLGSLTEHLPKTMLKIGDRSILQRALDHLHEFQINSVDVVAGFQKEAITVPGINVFYNSQYETTGQMVSLSKAEASLEGEVILLFGDILFRKYMLQLLLNDPGDVVIIVDTNLRRDRTDHSDFVKAKSASPQASYLEESLEAESLAFASFSPEYFGEWIGLMKLSARGTEWARQFIESHKDVPDFEKMDIRDMLNDFIRRGIAVNIQPISGHWVDVNQIEDLATVSEFKE